jgi:selenocysteine-specific elongation factor
MEASQRIDVRLDVLAGARAVRHGARVRFHQGTAELLGRVAVVEGVEIAPGASGFARIRLEKPAVVTRGDRFIIRAYSPPDTVGGGVVLDPQAPRGAIRTAAALTRFRAIDATVAPHEAARAMVAERGAMGLGTLALTSRAGVAPEGCGELMRALGTGVTLVGDTVMSSTVLAGLSEQLLAAIAAHHKTEPLAGGLPREEARERLFARAASGVFEHVVERLLAAGKITARDRLALAGQGVSLTADEARARDAIERVYREAGLAPPDAASAASSAHADASTADRMTKLLLRERKLMKLDTLIFHVDALEQLKGEIRGMKAPAGAGKVDVATFKERYGISRKYAIPLLEYLDRERVTRRVGDARVVL